MTYHFDLWRLLVALLGAAIFALGLAGAMIVLLARTIKTWRNVVR